MVVAQRVLFPLSFQQERLWQLENRGTGDMLYHVQIMVRLRGPLVVDAFIRALRALVTRHEVLRIAYQANPTGAQQAITHADGTFLAVPVRDVPGEAAALDAAATLSRQRFDLTAAPPVRAELMRESAEKHLLVLCIHHIAIDHPSVAMLIGELGDAYRAELTGDRPDAALVVGYLDFVRRQRTAFGRERHDDVIDWWMNRLSGAEAVQLPADRRRSAAPPSRWGTVSFEISAAVGRALQDVVVGVEPYTVMLAVFLVLLRRYTGQTDLVVGSPSTGLTRPRQDGMIGLMADVLAHRFDVRGDPSFTDVVLQTRDVVHEVRAHQDAPIGEVLARDAGDRDLTRVVFDLVSPEARIDGWTLDGLHAEPLALPYQLSPHDVSVTLVTEPEGSFLGRWQYDTDLYDRATANAMARHFVRLAAAFADDATRSVITAPMLDRAESRALGATSNRADRANTGHSVDRLGTTRAGENPGAVALRKGDHRLDDTQSGDHNTVANPPVTTPGRGDVEQRLHRIWSELLERPRIERTESFFDAGGHSLLLIDLHADIADEFGADVELLDLFRNPTIAAQAKLLMPDEPAPHTAPDTPAVTHASRADALAGLRVRRQGK